MSRKKTQCPEEELEVKVVADQSAIKQPSTSTLAKWEAHLQVRIQEMVDQLGLPLNIYVKIRWQEGLSRPFGVGIGKHTYWPVRTFFADKKTRPETWMQQVLFTVYHNRTCLVTEKLAGIIRKSWSLSSSGMYLPELTGEEFVNYLRLLVKYGFHIQRGHHLNDSGIRYEKHLSSEACFEEAINNLDIIKCILYAGKELAKKLGEEGWKEGFWKQIVNEFFFDYGVRIPKCDIKEETCLTSWSWSLQINDLRVPSFTGLREKEIVLSAIPGKFDTLGYQGECLNFPYQHKQFLKVESKKTKDLKLEEKGLQIIGGKDFFDAWIKDFLLHHLSMFLTKDMVAFELDLIHERIPTLVESFRQRFTLTLLLQITRKLLEEKVAILYLRGIVEALLSTHERQVEVDELHAMSFVPYRLNPVVKKNMNTSMVLDYLDNVRMYMFRNISQHYLVQNLLPVFLLEKEMEEIIRSHLSSMTPDPSTAAKILSEIHLRTIGAEKVLLLVPVDIRYAVLGLLAGEMPWVAVISYAELYPEQRLDIKGRIGWPYG